MPDSTIPFHTAAGETLSEGQGAYLDGFFAGLKNRGYRFSDLAPIPDMPSALPSEPDLIPEERLKRELHPLDSYPLLLQHAAAHQAPDKENTYRFKWHGLFYLSPTKEGFMARLRIPGGALRSFQLRELATIADTLTSGYIQITTRSNLQMRLIQPKDAPEFLRRVQAIGLHTRGAGADNVRNLTCDATSGVDVEELIETLPLVEELAACILHQREFYDLPRKFNIALHGGGSIPTLEETNDIGFRAVRVPAGPAEVPPGVYFRAAVGGATGHKAFASDLGVLIPPDRLVATACAMLRVYLQNGNRSDRKKARLKHLLEHWSLHQFLEATESQLGIKLPRVHGFEDQEENRRVPRPHPHVGIHPQKQAGLFWIGASVPVGQLTSKQMRRVAELAELYGSGEIRLTVWQSLILPNIREAFIETVARALKKIGFDTRQSNLRSGFVACTGNSYCKFAGANTKGHALELMDYLDRRVQLDVPVNVHLTGCPNSCAQHYIGDLGLLGAKVKVNGESVEGYHIFVGGGFGSQTTVGRQLFQGVSVAMLPFTMEKILQGFLAHRHPGESFRGFTTRHDVRTLQELLG
ncbi:MAG: NirA family protein [Verrucomicrobia bacterium]|nr:NirA family protein [Verrucomicrobiota bacterium]